MKLNIAIAAVVSIFVFSAAHAETAPRQKSKPQAITPNVAAERIRGVEESFDMDVASSVSRYEQKKQMTNERFKDSSAGAAEVMTKEHAVELMEKINTYAANAREKLEHITSTNGAIREQKNNLLNKIDRVIEDRKGQTQQDLELAKVKTVQQESRLMYERERAVRKAEAIGQSVIDDLNRKQERLYRPN